MTMTHVIAANALASIIRSRGWSVEWRLQGGAVRLTMSPPDRWDDPIQGAIFSDEPEVFWLHVDPYMEFAKAFPEVEVKS